MSSARDVARALAPKERSTIPLMQGVVTQVIGAVAEVTTANGTKVPAYPDSSGRLPVLGKSVWGIWNGQDLNILGGEMQAVGAFQSPDWAGPTGTEGWGLGADGRLYAAAGIFRGDVVGARILTALVGPRVVIDATEEARAVSFPTGDTDEITAGAIRSYDDEDQIAVEIITPTINEDDEPGRVLLTVDRATGETALNFEGTNVMSNGVSISKPPLSIKRRVAGQSVGNSTSSFQTMVWDTDVIVNGGSAITYSAGTFTISRAGVYRVDTTIGWDDAAGAANGTGSREVRIVDNGSERDLETKNAVTARRSFHNCGQRVIVPDDTGYTVSVKVGQNSGGSLDATGRIEISRYSDY